MNEKWVIILVIIVILIYVWYVNRPPIPDKEMWLNQLELDTGDLVFFKATDNYNSSLIGNYYTHVGMVVKNPDGELMLFEADMTHAGELINEDGSLQQLDFYGSPKGIFLSPLIPRMIKYKGKVYVKKLIPDVAKNINYDGLYNFIDYALQNMYYQKYVGWNFLAKTFGEGLYQGTNCGEIVFLAMISSDIIPESNLDKHIMYHLKWVSNLSIYPELISVKIHKFGLAS